MDVRVIFEDSYPYKEIIGFVVPFLFGLMSSILVEFVKKRINNKHKKKFVLDYLTNNIQKIIPNMIQDAEILIKKLESDSTDRDRMKAFQNFTSLVLDSVTQNEYYSIFKQKKYKNFIDIYTGIKFLENNLPLKIHQDYIDKVEKHLKDKGLVGVLDHIYGCNFCKEAKKDAIILLNFRIDELNQLEIEINKITDNKFNNYLKSHLLQFKEFFKKNEWRIKLMKKTNEA